jgi:plasmid stabilization system protein ParE
VVALVRVRFRDEARSDLREILRYIAKDNPKAARAMVARLKARAMSLERSTSLGRFRPVSKPVTPV